MKRMSKALTVGAVGAVLSVGGVPAALAQTCSTTIHGEAYGRTQMVSEARARSLQQELAAIEARQFWLDDQRTVGDVLTNRSLDAVKGVFRAIRKSISGSETPELYRGRSVGGIRG